MIDGILVTLGLVCFICLSIWFVETACNKVIRALITVILVPLVVIAYVLYMSQFIGGYP